MTSTIRYMFQHEHVVALTKGGYHEWPISTYNEVPILVSCCIVQYVYFMLLYRNYMQKALFSVTQAIRRGWGIYVYDRSRHINALLNQNNSDLDLHNFI